MARKSTHHASWSHLHLALRLSFLLLASNQLPRCSLALSANSSRSSGDGTSRVPALCRSQEAAALLQLKGSFAFPTDDSCEVNTTTLSSWRSGTDCCRWEGVTCDGVTGRVTALNLSSRCLQICGGLQLALFNLTSLRYLNLEGLDLCGSQLPDLGLERLTKLQVVILDISNLSGSIPPSFTGLPHSLQQIHLSSNTLNGNISNLFSAHSFPHLRVLDLSWNMFEGTFPLGITQLKNLRVLDLRATNLSGDIPNSIGNLSLLRELHLYDNGLSGGLPWELSNMTYLTVLDCAYNNLVGTVPATIFTLPALVELDLHLNNFSGPIEEFHNASGTLAQVDLSNNQLTGTIPTSFLELTALDTIALDSNYFRGTVNLSSYSRLRSLTKFTASHNRMLSIVGEDQWTNSSISHLEFASCDLTSIPSVIRHLPQLDWLDLSYNGIGGNIPDWIYRNMSKLDLSHNMFTEVAQPPAYTVISDIDLSFNRLRGAVPSPSLLSASYLDYSNNKFSSMLPGDFLTLYGTATSINLANNQLGGTIPYAECDQFHYQYSFDGLQGLDLSSNNFSGQVPPYVLRGCNNALRLLNLRGNRLEGTWPDEMDGSCSLQGVDLHGNQIRGRLPRSLANCNDLNGLDVSGNNLVDSFPSWLGNLPSLRVLILRSNQFYGPVTTVSMDPAGYFSSLQIIDLAENGFTGVLTSELFYSFKAMAQGPMHQAQAVTSDKLGVILRVKVEEPRIPVEVAMKHQYMRMLEDQQLDLMLIDLSNNRFSGSIPRTVGNLTALLVLNLSRNAFTGEIPAELGRLSQVESLDLSWNHLTGEIPQSLASLTALEWLNLSYNDLSGSIPSGTQFSTFPSSSFQGGNRGLYGCPLPVRCNLTRPPSATKAPPPLQVSGGESADHRFQVIVLCLFVGSGFGLGFALAIVLQVVCSRRQQQQQQQHSLLSQASWGRLVCSRRGARKWLCRAN